MPGVLFSWELGRGAGHLTNIRRMAAVLKPLGFRITVAVPNAAEAVSILSGFCDEVLDVPAWPARAMTPAAQSSATFGDILAACGLADHETVVRLLTVWQDILADIAPDILIGDLAPASALAAHGRVPVLLVGNGFTLPPADLLAYPLLDSDARPQWSEASTLDAVNGALVSVGLSRLDALPRLFEGDARLVQAFALLDPYNTLRNELLGGPLFDGPPQAREPRAHDIFVYLSGDYGIADGLLAALRPFASRVRIYAPHLPDPERRELAKAGADVLDRPAPLGSVLAESALAIHNGGGGVAGQALAAGVPQLIISQQIEQDLNGAALQRAGVARLLHGYKSSTQVSADMIADLLTDNEVIRRATELGTLHRQILETADPPASFMKACFDLLRR